MKRLALVTLLLIGSLIAISCSGSYSEDITTSSAGHLPDVSPAPPAPTSRETGIMESSPTASNAVQSFDADTQRMIVRTADIRLIVGDTSAALERISQLAEDSKGYVVSSNMRKEGERLIGTITIRVPKEVFDNVMSILRGLSDEVTDENISASDVTEEYVDLSAKLKNLEATEAQLLEIMKKAEKIEDVLAVQRQLTTTRDDIERTKGRMEYLEQTSETSLIAVQLTQSKLDVKLTAVSSRDIKAGGMVYFKAEISGGFAPYTYKWDFGDKVTSAEEAPVHAYPSAGKYTVSLTVTDDRDNTAIDTRTEYITVQSGWSAGNTARNAWNGLRGFGRVLTDILIWLGIFSPVWIIGGGIGYWIWRKGKGIFT